MRVLGVLAGEDAGLELLRTWCERAELVVAADGAANALVRAGLRVDVLVGDLDSATEDAMSKALRVVRGEDQDTTDCDKLLSLVEAEGHHAITIVGIEGDEFDHALGSLQSLAKSKLSVRIALRRAMAWMMKDGDRLDLGSQPGRRLSLQPITPCMGVTLQGVMWPLLNSRLDPMGFTSVSNQVAESRIMASIATGRALLTVESGPDDQPTWD